MDSFSLSIPPLDAAGAALLLVLGAAYAAAAAAARRRRTGNSRGRLLWRTAAAALLLAVFLRPSIERRAGADRPPLAVVVDRSESMAAPDGGRGGETRWAAVSSALGREADYLNKRFSPSYYALGRGLEPLSLEALSAAKPSAGASDLSSLVRLRGGAGPRAVLLFSDGRHGGGADPVAAAARLGAPVFAFGAGRPDPAPDLILRGVRAPPFAFKGTDTEAVLVVEAKGFLPGKFTAEILSGGKTVGSAPVVISSGSLSAEVVVSFRPSDTGPRSYTARLPAYAAESNRRNNSRTFSLDVGRDRMRVLYICGKPGPHYAFLRHQLKSNPSVELVSFVILRDPEDAAAVPDHELSLIPFPTQDVLLDQLKSFDAVILEEFSFSSFGISPAALAALRQYVERGGGLLVMGSAGVLGPAGPYRGTPVEEILPSRLESLRAVPASHRLRAEEPGHPVMALSDDAEETRALWSRLPPLEGGGFLPAGVRPGALALASAETASPSGPPVLAAWSRGRGRVMTIHSLSSWRWALRAASNGGAWTYQRFWSNALSWLSGASDFRLVRLDLPSDPEPGPALVRALVLDENHRPLAEGDVQAVLRGPGGAVRRAALKPLGKGEYAESVALEEPGDWRVTAWAFSRGKKLGQDEKILRVGASWDETLDTDTDFVLLDNIARAGGGASFPLEDFSREKLKDIWRGASSAGRRTEPVWNSPWLLGALLIVLFGEWIWRRRRGEA
ncbi:MAG: glutamine amidotransferase [Elusimicrobiota bacterium]